MTLKINVGILGCTGMVGQRMIQLLENHADFEIWTLGASERSAGKTYEEACPHWKLATDIPEFVACKIVQKCQVEYFQDCRVIFSALDSSIAGEIESKFRDAGFAVFSNSKNHRMEENVPLLIAGVNTNHLKLIENQKQKFQTKGFIVTNPNCVTTGIAMILKPLHETFGIDSCHITTLQAISGAGFPGVSSIDILDNVIPFIEGEEDKLESEPLKILGHYNFSRGSIDFADFKISAHCNRVNVTDGHTANLSIKFKQSEGENLKVTPEKVFECLGRFYEHDEISPNLDSNFSPAWDQNTFGKQENQKKNIAPKSPHHPLIHLFPSTISNRPQPRLDRNRGEGFTVCVGQIRKDPIFDVKFTCLSHNTILGAAGGTILNCEAAKTMGLIS